MSNKLPSSPDRAYTGLDEMVHHTRWPCTPYVPRRHAHASAHGVPRRCHAPPALTTLLSAPPASQRHQQPQGHAHWPTGTLCTTPPSTLRHSTVRHRHALVLVSPRHRTGQRDRTDVAHTRASRWPPAPSETRAVDELIATATSDAIKGDLPCLTLHTKLALLPLLKLLDLTPCSISHRRRPISSPEPVEVLRSSPPLQAPQRRHCYQEMEPYVQTESYELGNGGSLVFERDLYLVSEKLERPPPQFHGVRIHNTPTGEQQWMITADLKGSPEPPISERILFSFKAYSWVDGLAHALQEGLARVCGQNIAALRGSRFAHFARHDTMGEPMALSSHPVLKIHVEHLDFMLHETRKDLELTRVHAHRAQMALAHHADAIRMLAKDRKSLRLQRAKKDATINRLREKIRTLEVTVRTQQDQIQEMEEDGEDIQGGDDFLSDDNDFEDDEFTDEEDYAFLESEEDGIIPIDVDEDDEE
ncbi:hypothetical protein QYE76_031232 [Lolium multiflorum]|uniref:Uncharacterized protein n=1 Tax=Lolium multiflorum TaxID=4521 RepID=A0AAD8QUM9_LOLMU|nr:hypothetical protein QYE76_031232 [Lolium multiflorum]